jgi:hypothetical protein
MKKTTFTINKMTSCLLALSASWLSPIMTFIMWTSGRVARIALHAPAQHVYALIRKNPPNPFLFYLIFLTVYGTLPTEEKNEFFYL